MSLSSAAASADAQLSARSSRRTVIAQTAAYYLAFIVVGMCGGQLGPSLSSLAEHTGSTLSVISIVFVASALGRLVGSLVAGWMLDRTQGHPLMATGILLVAVAMALIPMAQSLPVLVAALLLYGVSVNFIDVGANTLIVRAHGAKVAPYMNGLHLTFGIGGSLAPLLVGRSFAMSGDIRLSYWAAAALILPIAVWLLRLPSPVNKVVAVPGGGAPAISFRQTALLCAFFFCLVGIEILGAQWTFNLGLSLDMSREGEAAVLASTFWWMYSLGRLISIPLALRVKPGTYLFVDLAAGIVSTGLLLYALLAHTGNTLVWISIIGIGLSVASAFPSALSFVGSRMPMTGRITGMLFASANVAVMIVPWVVGQLFESVGSYTIAVAGLLMLVASTFIFVALGRALPHVPAPAAQR